MRTYGQFCPVAKAAEVFCERWTALILRDLAFGAHRFSELRRGVPLASPTILSRRLKQLEAEGIIERRRAATGRTWTYHLTPAGEEFTPLVLALGTWGQRWSRRDLADHEVDLSLLVWALERGARADAFGDRRCLVQITFADQPKQKRHWWYLNQGGHCEMCVDPPGFEIDLYVASDVRTMIRVWRGDISVGQALNADRLALDGAAWARRAFPKWLAVTTLAHVKSQRAA